MKKTSVLHVLIAASTLIFCTLKGQLEVGDISPDFTAPVCVNDNTEDGDWSLYDEGANKVTWINLFTSW